MKASPTVPIPLLFPSFEEVQKVGPFGNVEGEGEAKNIFENTFRHKLILSFFNYIHRRFSNKIVFRVENSLQSKVIEKRGIRWERLVIWAE